MFEHTMFDGKKCKITEFVIVYKIMTTHLCCQKFIFTNK